MKQLTCLNKKCNNVWNYGGSALFYATCSRCKWKVWINWTAEELQLIEQIKELEREEMKEVNNIEEEEV